MIHHFIGWHANTLPYAFSTRRLPSTATMGMPHHDHRRPPSSSSLPSLRGGRWASASVYPSCGGNENGYGSACGPTQKTCGTHHPTNRAGRSGERRGGTTTTTAGGLPQCGIRGSTFLPQGEQSSRRCRGYDTGTIREEAVHWGHGCRL